MISDNNIEKTATTYIPYDVMVDPHTCTTLDGDLTQTLHLSGLPFETLSNEEINGHTRQLFVSLNSLGNNDHPVALWTHVIRRKIHYDLSTINMDNFFSKELNRQYAAKIGATDFYVNDFYLSPVLRVTPGYSEKVAKKLSDTSGQQQSLMTAGIAELNKIVRQMSVSLRQYRPVVLGKELLTGGEDCSELACFYSQILNGMQSGPIRTRQSSVAYAIQRNDLHFGAEIIEIQGPAGSRFAGILGLKAPYGFGLGEIEVGSDLLRDLEKIPAEFILSQSLTFLPINKADKMLRNQITQIGSAEGNALLVKELKDAREQLQAGKFSMGEHEFILTIYGDSIKEVNEGISEAVTALQNKALGIVRERRGTLISQYFSMLPANFRMNRLRARPISTDNFVSFFPIQCIPSGDPQGSQWGMPLALLKTSSGGPYFLNFHNKRNLKRTDALEYVTPEELDKNAGEARQQRIESANNVLVGPNGSGKTVVQCFIRAMARKSVMTGPRALKTFAFDVGCGQETFTLALGGRYFRFKSGEMTGIAPCSLPNTPENCLFIVTLAQWCAAQDVTYKASSTDEERLMQSVKQIYELTSGRRFARLRDSLPKGEGTLHSALARWVEGGAYAWVLDSTEDRFDLEQANDFGFDMTTFLDVPYARTPILRYLMHKIDQNAPGSPHVIDIDEASKALNDGFMQTFIDDKARRIRKQQGSIGLSVQNAADLTGGILAPTLLNQFPNWFIFPNPQASKQDYIGGLNLGEREFDLVQKGMLDVPGKFLLKTPEGSVVINADLSGMNNMLSVLSGTPQNAAISREIIARVGPEPQLWLPEFFKRRA